MAATPNRVLMIGVDAGDIAFIEAAGEALPNLRRVLATGRRFDLESTAEVLTGSVWPTFYTGTLPGEHGVYHPIQWDPDAMHARRVSEDWLYCEPFWLDLEREGETVVAFDVPFTFPSRLGRGIEINGWGTHERLGPFFCSRAEVGRELRRRFGAHPMGHDTPVPRSRKHSEDAARRLAEGAGTKGRIARWLLGAIDWSLFLVVLGETHRGGHVLWPEPGYGAFAPPENAMRDVYRAVDGAVGEILAGAPADATVVVFSLHGMETNRSQGHFVRPVTDRVNASLVEGGSARRDDAPRGGLVRMLRVAVPGRLQHAIARAAPIQLLDWVSNREITGGVDWKKTPGFALRPDLHGYLRLNLVGREKAGALEPGSERHRSYVEELRTAFRSLTTGEPRRPIVRDILSMRDVFHGSRSALLPDLVVRWEKLPQATRVDSDAYGTISAEPDTGRCGEHRSRGFATLLGPWKDAALPPLAHGTDFPRFVRALLGRAPVS
ncbi:MAG TPA: alkaline phosphatase family protein [Thermoanaerobaculia bacterium]|nr:alkaline phosphatase family protein [Thermoanaerobaculia bacterium]